MGKRGPKGKTEEELRASGSWREPVEETPEELENPQSGPGLQTAPAWMSAEEVEIWDRLLPTALEMKTYTAADHDSFGQLCRAFSKLLKVQAELEKHGDFIDVEYMVGAGKDRKLVKTQKESPLVKIEKTRQTIYNNLATQFGFNPLSRTRLKIVPYTKIPLPSVPNKDAPPIADDEFDTMMGIKKTI